MQENMEIKKKKKKMQVWHSGQIWDNFSTNITTKGSNTL